jgi:hypothetical protein
MHGKATCAAVLKLMNNGNAMNYALRLALLFCARNVLCYSNLGIVHRTLRCESVFLRMSPHPVKFNFYA